MKGRRFRSGPIRELWDKGVGRLRDYCRSLSPKAQRQIIISMLVFLWLGVILRIVELIYKLS